MIGDIDIQKRDNSSTTTQSGTAGDVSNSDRASASASANDTSTKHSRGPIIEASELVQLATGEAGLFYFMQES